MNVAPCCCGDPDCDWLHNPQDRIRLTAADWLPVDLPRERDAWDAQSDRADFADEYARDAEKEAAE
jgi:hypothetical protein